MKINLSDYQRVKAAAERAKEQRDQAIGAHKAALQRLLKEWNCSTIKEAKEKLARMEASEAEMQNKIQKVLAEFQSKWGHLIQED